MKSVNTSFFLLLAFVFLTTTGFTCQKKYPQPAPETESSQSESTTSDDSGLSSSENSNSPSETTASPEGDSQKPVDKTDQ